MILSTVRRAAESKKWDRIVVSASNSTIFNQLISNFPVYFPKQQHVKPIEEQWTPESDDKNSDEQYTVTNNNDENSSSNESDNE